MQLEIALYIFAAILIAYGLLKWNDKKADMAKMAAAAGAGIVVIVLLGSTGLLAPLAAAPVGPTYVTTIPVDMQEAGTICDATGALIVSNLTYKGDTWSQSGANSPTGPAGTFVFYYDGTDVTLPGVTALDTITITSGVGSTASAVLKSCTDYEIWFNGASAQYDAPYPGSQITPVLTDTGVISNQLIELRNIRVVASVDDLIEEDATDGSVNGQTTSNGTDGCGLAIQVGTDSTPADGDTMYYNKTDAGDTFYLIIEPGATGADDVLIDPVLCPVRLANPMEGTEFSQVLMTYRQGTDFGVPQDVTAYFTNHECIPLGDEMIGGTSGEYKLNFNVVEANFEVSTDVLHLYMDDLGGYQETDTFHNLKAAASGLQIQAE